MRSCLVLIGFQQSQDVNDLTTKYCNYTTEGQGNAVTCRRSFGSHGCGGSNKRDFLEFVMECHQTTDVREIYVCTYI